MRLDVLGCSGTYPTAGAAASGYLLSQDQTEILCDVGFGVLAELTKRIAPDEVDAVVLSHRHPDHCADFFALYHALAYGPFERRGIPVFCAPGLPDRIAEFVAAGEGHILFDLFDFHEVGDTNHAEVGAFFLRFAVTSHSVPTIATRFEALGRSVTYSADTGPGGGFPGLARDSHVMVAEATISGRRDVHHFVHHLTAEEAAEIAKEANVDKLILTHLPPSVDMEQSLADARAVFGEDVALASPGDVYVV
jgi:ribonuclease BN (tRNA processing enzyme)